MTDENIGTSLMERQSVPPAVATDLPSAAYPVRPVVGGALAQPYLPAAPTDKLAITSAICGLVPVIPVISQLAGVVLGIMAIGRIRAARQRGVAMGGMGWAIAGIVSSVVFLIASVIVLIILGSVLWLFVHSANTLDQIAVNPARP